MPTTRPQHLAGPAGRARVLPVFRFRLAVLLTWVCSLGFSSAAAQDTELQGAPIRWWHGAVVAGGVASLFLVDGPVRQFAQDRRSPGLDRAAAGFRQLGEPVVVLPASLGAWGLGLARDDDDLAHTGARATTSLMVATVLVHVGKLILGRERPSVSGNAFAYDPFSGLTDKSLPSGHTAIAFAFASSLADDDRSVARIALYAAATGTAWSRVNDNKHWASDVALGAVVGMTSAKLVRGRWTIFGLETPSYLAADPNETTGFGEVALGMGAGIGLFYFTNVLLGTLQAGPPVIAPMMDGGVGLAWQLQF
jgi:membrane-associated phospholipid phosphatase